MNVAFFSVIFPEVKEFINDFLISLSQQSFKGFDIILVNDGYPNFGEIKSEFADLNFVEIPPSSSPVMNRVSGISWIIENGYDYIIFGDADDYFSPNRIEVSVSLLKENGVVFNDLTTVNKSGIINEKYLSNRLKKNQEIAIDFIENKNVLGLSNTAIQTKLINSEIEFPEEQIAFDWAFFSYLMLKNNSKAIFTNETISYYRQHDSNTIGLQNCLGNPKKIIEVKFQHYKFLSKFRKEYVPKMEKYRIFLENCSVETNNEIKYPLWWEGI